MSTDPLRLGAFDLLGPLGRGGMGLVWHGIHRASGQSVAIKTVRTDLSWQQEKLELFEQEIRAVATLESPRIVRVFDYGRIPVDAERAGEPLLAGSPYLVMEEVGGGSLLKRCASIPWAQARIALHDVLLGLAHSHARGVVHRDLKPANVLCVEGSGPGEAAFKLTDFGIAFVQRELDKDEGPGSERVCFSPSYVAPESIDRSSYTTGPWTDLYAVGCLAWTLVCGTSPFHGLSLQEIVDMQREEDFGAFEPSIDVPPYLVAWILHLMRRRPSCRFDSAAEAARSLMSLEGTMVGHSSTLEVPSSWRLRGRPGGLAPPAHAGLGLYGLRCPPFVGRETERDQLWSAFRDVSVQGGTRALLLHGPPGTGKTALAGWLCEEARELGLAEVAEAVHDEQGGPGVGTRRLVADMVHLGLASDGRPLGARHQRRCLDERLRSVGLLEPEMRDALWEIALPSSPGEERVQFESAEERRRVIVTLLRAIASHRPLIVWLDDVQWGADSLALARLLLSEAPQRGGILVLMTLRDEALVPGSAAAQELAGLRALPVVEDIRLDALADSEMRGLLDELLILQPELAQELVERSGGTPLYAVQLLGNWVHRGLLRSTDQGFELEDGVQLTFPDDLLDVWTERLAGATASASPQEVQALQLAAALGRDVGREEWILVCAQEGFVVPFGLIGRLADIGIVREQEGGFRFAHDLAREAVVRRSREEGSWASHTSRCADAIASLGTPGSAERCALLLLDAGRIEDAAEAYLRAAVWVGELGDDRHSIELYTVHGALLDRLGAEPEDERRIEAGLRALERKRSYGQYDVLIEEAQRLGAVARQQSWRSLEARALYLEALGRRNLEGDSASIPPLERAVELFDKARPEDTGIRTRLLLGRVLSTSGQFERAEAETRRALADAEQWGSPLSQSRALQRMADVLNMVGKADEAAELLEKALDLVGRHGLLRAEIRVRIVAAGSMVRLGKTDEAAAHISRARDLAVRLGHKGDISDACTLQGEVERMRGNLALAENAYREALRLSTELKSGWVAAPRSNLGLIRLQLGLYEEARALLEEARSEFLAAGRRGLGDFLACLLLPCYAALGDWGAWTEIWPAIARFAPGTSLAELDSACLLVQAAELALRVGEAERGQAAGQMAVLHYRALGRAAEANLLAVRYGLEQSESTDS